MTVCVSAVYAEPAPYQVQTHNRTPQGTNCCGSYCKENGTKNREDDLAILEASTKYRGFDIEIVPISPWRLPPNDAQYLVLSTARPELAFRNEIATVRFPRPTTQENGPQFSYQPNVSED